MARSDATRNREKILAAARAAFASPGAEVSMAEVARRAEVGMATLYRNFPGRRELLEALYADEVDALCAAATTAEGDTPGARFEHWVRRFVDYFAGKRHIASELLQHVEDDRSVFDRNRDRVFAAGAPLLAAAQEAGEIRADLSLEQILDLLIAVAKLSDDPAYTEPILQAALDGLRRAA